jgi:phytoene synthase
MQPRWSDPGFASPADLAQCRADLRTGSRTFYAASFLLPEKVREPAASLYAFCRLADDAVDLDPASATTLVKLADRLERIYAGNPADIPADRALADVVIRYAIPKDILEALLDGFAWDAQRRRYETIDDLHGYATRVAGTVGIMMAMLMGQREETVLARACDLGIAMQLTNIARDVGEDARAGRLYLPLAWMRSAGLDPDAWLAEPHDGDAIRSVIARLLEDADLHYERAVAGIAALPSGCRPGIEAARLLYAEIGRQLERNGLNSVSQRAIVPASRKAKLLARALTPPLRRRSVPLDPAPTVPAAGFVVAAAAKAPPAWAGTIGLDIPWWDLAARVVWVIELFERLERRQMQPQPRALAGCETNGGGP